MSTERRQALVVLALPPVVAAAGGSPSAALRALVGPAGDALGTGPLLGATALLAWALTGWMALVVAVTQGARLPGAVGAAAQHCLPRVAPSSVRALVRTATGVAVAGTVLLSGAAAHADSLDWPTTSPTATATSTSTSAPAAAGPTATATPASAMPPSARAADLRPAPAHPLPRRPAVAAPVGQADTVVVRPGDCLWHLAADALGPAATPRQIAEAWPAWWSANRAVIGKDPNLLRPGTTLQSPTLQPPTLQPPTAP